MVFHPYIAGSHPSLPNLVVQYSTSIDRIDPYIVVSTEAGYKGSLDIVAIVDS